MSDTDALAALRVEYAAARLDLERAMDAQHAGNTRLHELANRVQALYLALHLAEKKGSQ